MTEERNERQIANPNRVRVDGRGDRVSDDPHDQRWDEVADEVRDAVEEADVPATVLPDQAEERT